MRIINASQSKEVKSIKLHKRVMRLNNNLIFLLDIHKDLGDFECFFCRGFIDDIEGYCFYEQLSTENYSLNIFCATCYGKFKVLAMVQNI